MFEPIPLRSVAYIESKDFMKSTVEVHILTPHPRHFCSANLNAAWYDRRNPPWSSGCTRSSLGKSLLYRSVENSLYNDGRVQNWPVISSLLHATLLVYYFNANSSPCRWSTIFLLQYVVEDLSHHLFRLFAARFDVFSAYSVVVSPFAFF